MQAPPLAADEELALRVADRLREEITGPVHRILVEVQNHVVILEESSAPPRSARGYITSYGARRASRTSPDRLTTWDDELTPPPRS